MPGFAQQNHVSKLRVINPGSDSLEVESLSSAMAPPPCYSSYKEGTTTSTAVCVEDSMEHDNSNGPFESDSHSAHSVAACPRTAPPGPWLEQESPPSPYPFEDLPKIVHQPEVHSFLGPAAPSSTYTHSCVLGASRSQSRITHDVLAVPSDNRTTRTVNSASELRSLIPSGHATLPFGHASTPNFSSLCQQGASQSQVYRHTPVSQPLLSRAPHLPNTGANGEATASQVEQIPTSDAIGSSGFRRGLFSTRGSIPFGYTSQGLPTNFVSLSRKSTYRRQTFPLLPSRRKTNPSSIMGVFIIDPQLRLPAGLLKLVDSTCPSVDDHSATLQSRRKNLVLEAEDGGIDVDIQIVPSKVPQQIGAMPYPPSVSLSMMAQQPQPRRSMDKRHFQLGGGENESLRRSVAQPISSEIQDATCLDLRLKEGHWHGKSGNFQVIARINAPNPRPPIHLIASTIDLIPPTQVITNADPNPKRTQSRRLQSRSHPRSKLQARESNKSPIILHLPHNLHGPLTVHITAGNIDAHVRLSKEVSRVAAILTENSVSRGYFISSRGLTEFGGQFCEGLDVVMESEEGWVMVEGMGPGRGVVNNRNGLSMPRGGDHVGRDEEWYGDKVDVFVGDGKVYLQFLDERDPFGRQKGFWQKFGIGLGCR